MCEYIKSSNISWVLVKYNPYVEWLLNSYIIWLIDKILSHKEWWETAFFCKERFP